MNEADSNYRRGIIEILICYLLWGVFPIFWKQLAMLNPFYVLSSRIVWSALFCFIIVLCTKHTTELKAVLADRKKMGVLTCSSIMIAINWGTYIYAVNSGYILDASLGYYLSPLLSILLGFIVFREKLRKLQWVAIAIAMTGIMVAVIAYGTIPYFALILSLSFSGYGAIKKNISCSGLVSTLIEAAIMAPFMIIFIIMSEHSGSGAIGVMSTAQFFLLPATGIVTSLPLLAFSSGISKVPLSLSGILMYINPTIQLLLGVILYNERLDLSRIIMFVCIWIAIILFLISQRYLPSRKKEQQCSR